MSKLKPVHILIIVAVIIVLGAAAWSVGWAARRLVGPNAAPTPTAMEIATATEQSAPTAIPATAAPSTPSPVADDTPQATSTAMPPPPLTPPLRTYIVKPGQGLAEIAGIVCPDLTSYADREKFAYQIQARNPNKVQNIHNVRPGVELVIPPCPGD
jgi:hypothetical protein